MKSHTEIEIKLITASPETLKELFALDFIKKKMSSEITIEQLESRYFDTPRRKFAKAGIVFRVRKERGGFAATAKLENKNSGGLSERLEYTVDLASAQPDFTKFDKVNFLFDLSALMEKEGRVEELFSVPVERRRCELTLSGGTVVEMAVDTGEIIAGDKAAPVAEVEFEIVKGRASDLLDFIAEFTRLRPFFSEWRSKYYRGCELSGEKTVNQDVRVGELKPPLKKSLLSVLTTRTGRTLTALTRAAFFTGKKTAAGLKEETRRLRQWLFFARPLLEPAGFSLHDKKLAAIEERLQKAALLDGFVKRWEEMEAQALMDSNPDPFGNLLAEQNARSQEELREYLKDGQPAADIFALWAWLAGEPWKDDKNTLVADYLKEQRQYLKRQMGRRGIETPRLILTADSLLYTLSCQGKAGRKTLTRCRDMLLAKAKMAAIGEILFSLFKSSASRLTYRDAGALYGSYWQELTADDEKLAALLNKISGTGPDGGPPQ